MALSKDRQFRNSPSITLEYHRITQIRYIPGSGVNINFESYVSEAERIAGASAIEQGNVHVPIAGITREEVPETTDKDGNVVSAHTIETEVNNEAGIAPGSVMEFAYSMWKKHPDFADALDI